MNVRAEAGDRAGSDHCCGQGSPGLLGTACSEPLALWSLQAAGSSLMTCHRGIGRNVFTLDADSRIINNLINVAMRHTGALRERTLIITD